MQRMRRFAQSRFMPEECDIERFTSVRDEFGDETQTWVVASSGVPCMRHPLSGQELVLADRFAPEVNTRISMPFGTDVTANDRLVVAGRRYSIDYIPDVSPGLQAAVNAFCRFIENV